MLGSVLCRSLTKFTLQILTPLWRLAVRISCRAVVESAGGLRRSGSEPAVAALRTFQNRPGKPGLTVLGAFQMTSQWSPSLSSFLIAMTAWEVTAAG